MKVIEQLVDHLHRSKMIDDQDVHWLRINGFLPSLREASFGMDDYAPDPDYIESEYDCTLLEIEEQEIQRDLQRKAKLTYREPKQPLTQKTSSGKGRSRANKADEPRKRNRLAEQLTTISTLPRREAIELLLKSLESEGDPGKIPIIEVLVAIGGSSLDSFIELVLSAQQAMTNRQLASRVLGEALRYGERKQWHFTRQFCEKLHHRQQQGAEIFSFLKDLLTEDETCLLLHEFVELNVSLSRPLASVIESLLQPTVNSRIRVAALDLIRRTQSTEIDQASIVSFLGDGDRVLLAAGIKALASMGYHPDLVTTKRLMELVNDEDPTIAEAAATVLARYLGRLKLEKSTAISDAAIAKLSEYQGVHLQIDGLTRLSDGAAESLARYRGRLLLDGVCELSDTAARTLFLRPGALALNGLRELSENWLEAVSLHQGPLWLDGLVSISARTASFLGKHRGDLSLSGLTDVSGAVAECLAQHRGSLMLNGLTQLSDYAATYLSNHIGRLELGSLASVSVLAARHLARGPVRVSSNFDLWPPDAAASYNDIKR